MRRNSNGEYEIPGQMFTQNGQEYILTTINHRDLEQIAFVETFCEGNQKGNQRTASDAHIRQFTKDIVEHGATRPQGLVGTLQGPAKWEPKHEGSNLGKIKFPSASGPFISLQDGQHGLQSVSRALHEADMSWDWAIVLSNGADWKHKIKMHHSINAHQKKSDKSQLMHQNILIGNADPITMRAGRIILRLNDEATSVLHNRVKLFDVQKKRTSLNDIITRIVPAFRIGCIAAMDDKDLYDLIYGYYNEWQYQNPLLWNDTGNFVIGMTLGIKVLSGFMVDAFKHLALTNGDVTLDGIKCLVAKTKSRKMNWSRSNYVETHGYQVETHLHKELVKKSGIGHSESCTDSGQE